MNSNPLHVTIIGAGLGGLCLAQGLKKIGIAFDVYERDATTESRSQGYRLRIDQTGQQSLASCLPTGLYSLLTGPCAIPSTAVKTINSQLEQVSEKWVKDWHDGKPGTVPDLKINRLTMREVLLTGIREHVHFNMPFSRYSEHAGRKLTCHFDDGSSVHTDILIGADGVNSRVRQQRFPDAIPKDTGDVCIYGKAMFTDASRKAIAAQLQSETSVMFENGLAVVVDAMRFRDALAGEQERHIDSVKPALSAAQDYIYWAMIGKRARFGLDDEHDLHLSHDALRSLIGTIIRDWSPSLKALFELSDSTMLTLIPVRTAATMVWWPSTAVTALGDAIHVMSPASGLGANSALFDAAALVQTLGCAVRGEMDLIEAIAEYEKKLRGRSFSAVAASTRGSKQLFG